jgi:hypothetical protein
MSSIADYIKAYVVYYYTKTSGVTSSLNRVDTYDLSTTVPASLVDFMGWYGTWTADEFATNGMSDSNALWIHFIILFTCTFYKGFDLTGTCYDNVWADVWLNGGSPADDYSYLAAADMFTWKGWLTAYSAYVLNNLSTTVISSIALNFVYALAYTYNAGWTLCGSFDATGVLPILSADAFPYWAQSDPIPWFFGIVGIC